MCVVGGRGHGSCCYGQLRHPSTGRRPPPGCSRAPSCPRTPHCTAPHLRVGGGGVGDEGGGGTSVGAQALHELCRVRVKVVRHIGQRDLGRVEVLEGDVHRLHGGGEHVAVGLAAGAGAVGVEGKRLAAEVHLLQLLLVAPAAVLHRQVDVGGVGACGGQGRAGQGGGGRGGGGRGRSSGFRGRCPGQLRTPYQGSSSPCSAAFNSPNPPPLLAAPTSTRWRRTRGV